MFINLTAAYDTVWHRGLTCKLLRLVPDKHMVRMIMELVQNRSFTLTTGDSKPSRLRRLRNGVPQRLVLASLDSTFMYTICLPLPPRSSPMLATWRYFTRLENGRSWKGLSAMI